MAVHAQSSIQLNTIPAYTSLLGGHFVYRAHGTQGTPASANVVESSENLDNPAQWGYNTHIGANGIKLRYNENDLSSWTSQGISIYNSTTHNPAMQLSGQALNFYNPNSDNLTLSLNSSGLNFYGSSTSTSDASLTSTGLVLSKGGVKAGTDGQKGFVYLSSEDYPLKDATNSGLTINTHTPTAKDTDGRTEDDPAWREVIGSRFGVDSEGNLYANNAHLNGANVEGAITATSLTIGSGSSAYDGTAAINISGYTIEITTDSTGVVDADTTVYLYPHLYHNGIEVTTGIDYSHFIWYRNDDSIGTEGDVNNQGRYLATYGDSYRVVYDFDDGAVGGGTEVQTRTVDPSKYITRINDMGITIHPEVWNNESSYIQLDGTGMELFNSSGVSIAQYRDVVRIGINNSSRFLMNVDSLQAYNSNNQKYFEVNENGLTWGNNVAATVAQVEAAGQASKYITKINDQGVKVHAYNDNTQTADELNYLSVTSDGINIYQSDSSITPTAVSIAQFGMDGARIGKEYNATLTNNESYLVLDYHSMQMIDKEGKPYFYVSDLRDKNGIATVVDIFQGDGKETTFYFSAGNQGTNIVTNVTINDTSTSDYRATNSKVTFNSSPAKFSTIKITYTATSSKIKAYTFGTRRTGTIGCMSIAEGNSVLSSGSCSHAEGSETIASGYASHAEGATTKATGSFSHAEGELTEASGLNSHAEGFWTKASNTMSHAEGYCTKATGYASHAEGSNTVAQRYAQTVIGEYNIPDTDRDSSASSEFSDEEARGKYIFIIGNGSLETEEESSGQIIPSWINYSNAFTVDWSGNIQYAGSSTKMSDKRLKKHKSYLSTDAIKFIQKLKPVYFEKDSQFHTGFYAQDVEEIDPWNCMTGEMNGYKTLGYDEIIAPLVTYCQHLEKRIDELENKIKEE